MDIYEALTAADRPYKKPVPPDKAFQILESMAEEGKLHGELVALFKKSKIWEAL
jgi:HD-GYP domain-containing protein (c-di-GMP phosphodiesterase class II)